MRRKPTAPHPCRIRIIAEAEGSAIESVNEGSLVSVPTINLTADELAAVTAAIRRAIEDDRFPHAPRLDPLRAALGKFEAAAEPTPHPKASPAGKGDKRARL